MEIGDRVWEIVNKWDYFNKDTLGKQFVKAADSVACISLKDMVGSFIKKIRILITTVAGPPSNLQVA